MPYARCLSLILAVAAASTVFPCLAREPSAPLSVYGNLPFLEELALSPDGKKIAFIRTQSDARVLFVAELGSLNSAKGMRVGDSKLRGLDWQDDDTLMIVYSSTSPPPFGFTGATREWFLATRYSWSDKRMRPVTFDMNDREQTFNSLAGGWSFRSVEGKSMLFAPGLVVGTEVMPALFGIALNGSTHIVARGPQHNTDWLVDADGKVAAELAYNDRQQSWNLRARRDGSSLVSVASGKAAIDYPQILGFSADRSSIVIETMDKGVAEWRPVSIKDGNMGATLDEGRVLRAPIFDQRDGRIIGGLRGADERQYVFFDNELQAHWNAVLRAFPNEIVNIVSHSSDWSRIIVRVFGAKDGYSYHLFDWYTHQVAALGHVYDKITRPAEIRRVEYKAADGLVIPAILTVPSGLEAKNLPLVVLPHGGPAVTEVENFDWWGQALADQGYVVLQPNFRGSTVSAEFLEKGYGEWGRKMQTDLSDGVAYLAHEGIIDPKRVCIVGASYGGYAALAGATLQPDVWRCAVSVAGIGDLGRFRDWVKDNHYSSTLRYWDRFLGNAEHDNKAVKEISPVEHVAAVNAPVLLIHGKDDTVVPYEQSEVMEKALKKAGKQVEFVTLKHEDHWLSRSATRLQMLEATVAFLKKNNPPD